MKRLFLVFFYLLFGTCFKVAAQGNGSDGILTINSTTIINATRSKITAGASVGTTTLSIASSSGFGNGNLILIIQMQGSNQGKYEVRTVSSVTATSITFTPGLTNAYYSDASNFAQIIKIPQYNNVIINSGGILTTTAWDGSTGGVLVFYANGTVNVKTGGMIEATGLGGQGGTGGTGGTGGAGGSGGTGGGTIVGGADGLNGGVSSGGAAGGAGGPVALGLLAGGNGGNGGSGGVAGVAGTVGTVGYGPGAGSPGAGGTNGSSIPTTLMIGGGGAGGNGGNGGTGAGGGGGGGSGTLLTNSGSNGTAGAAGGVGGDGGNGGNGGGIIFIKANLLIGSGLIYAKGTAGYNGASGTAGGNGGNGGKGGELLTGIVPLNGGGGGGSGKGANGGGGGSAGGGGGGGAIYIEANNLTSWLGTVSSNAGISGLAGTGGAGGVAGTAGVGGRGLNLFGLGQNGQSGNVGAAGNAGPAGATATVGIGTSMILPIELLSFTATVFQEKYIQLNWETATEKNSDYFLVERSMDATKFTEVSRVKSIGNSNSIVKYNTIDESPLYGTTYYRLVQRDFNGQVFYSQIISVAFNNTDFDDLFYPNPVEVASTLNFKNIGSEDTYNVMFYNNIGAMVYSHTVNLGDGAFYSLILPECLVRGLYYVTIDSEETRIRKLLLVR